MHNVPAAIHAVSGAIGSSSANFALFPLDIVAVRQQIERNTDIPSSVSKKHHSSIMEMLKHIIKREGWGALYKGALDDLFGTILQAFLYFYTYEILRSRHIRSVIKIKGYTPRVLEIQYELWYGAVAGILCKFVTTPIKNIVVLKQTDSHSSDSSLKCIKTIYEKKGFTGFWSGYKATAFLSINPSLSYYFFQLLNAHYKKSTTLAIFLKAAIAKSLATILTYPIIQAKTRTQASQVKTHILKDMWNSLHSAGVSQWFDGIDAQLLKGFFVQGITMATKESVLKAVVLTYIALMRKHRVGMPRLKTNSH